MTNSFQIQVSFYLQRLMYHYQERIPKLYLKKYQIFCQVLHNFKTIIKTFFIIIGVICILFFQDLGRLVFPFLEGHQHLRLNQILMNKMEAIIILVLILVVRRKIEVVYLVCSASIILLSHLIKLLP